MVLPFAKCFVCKEMGHLSSQCSSNENGVYIKGGCCKQCGSKVHLIAFCPELLKQKAADKEKEENGNDDDEQSAGDVQEFLEDDDSNRDDEVDDTEEEKAKLIKKKKKKVVNF